MGTRGNPNNEGTVRESKGNDVSNYMKQERDQLKLTLKITTKRLAPPAPY